MKLERLKKVLSEYKWAIALLMLALAVNTLEITSEYDKDELIRFHVMADNDTVQAQAETGGKRRGSFFYAARIGRQRERRGEPRYYPKRYAQDEKYCFRDAKGAW